MCKLVQEPKVRLGLFSPLNVHRNAIRHGATYVEAETEEAPAANPGKDKLRRLTPPRGMSSF